MAHRSDPPARSSAVAQNQTAGGPQNQNQQTAGPQAVLLEQLQSRHKAMLDALLSQTTDANSAYAAPFATTFPIPAFPRGAGVSVPSTGAPENQMTFAVAPTNPGTANPPSWPAEVRDMNTQLGIVNKYRDASGLAEAEARAAGEIGNTFHSLEYPGVGVANGAETVDLTASRPGGKSPSKAPGAPGGFPTPTENPPETRIVVHRSRNRACHVNEYTMADGPLHVARELDVDNRGRTMVGVESGPHKELRVALQRLGSNPRYGALRMADELILLTAGAVIYRDDAVAVTAPDGASRFLITNVGYHDAINEYGSWVVDANVVEDVITDVMDEADRAKNCGAGGDGAHGRSGKMSRRESKKQTGSAHSNKPVRAYEKKSDRSSLNVASAGVSGNRETNDAGGEGNQIRRRGRPRKYPLPANPGTTSAEDRKSPYANKFEGRGGGVDVSGSRSDLETQRPLVGAAMASSGSETSDSLSSEDDVSGNAPMKIRDSSDEDDDHDHDHDRSKRRKTVVKRLVLAAQRAAAQRVKAGGSGVGKGKRVTQGRETPGEALDLTRKQPRSESAARLFIPFLDVEISGSDIDDTHIDHKRSTAQTPPSAEEYHALRGFVLGSLEVSLSTPSMLPPAVGDAQFQVRVGPFPNPKTVRPDYSDCLLIHITKD